MRIAGFQSTTLLDYPGHLACTVFTQGCNFRCPYCQNGSLVLPDFFDDIMDEDRILAKIKSRSKMFEGVCVSGGEPTNQPDLAGFLAKIKDMGLLVKLDSNGSRPEILKSLYKDGLIDMIAMDIKSSKSAYLKVCGLDPDSHPDLLKNIEESVDFIRSSGIDYEFRTTLVKGLHDKEQIKELADWLAGSKAYFLQSYQENDNILCVLNKDDKHFESFSHKELDEFLSVIREKIPSAELRGLD